MFFCNAQWIKDRVGCPLVIMMEFIVATIAAVITMEFVSNHTAADIVMFLFLVPQFLIAVKRAHDRNISTWVVSAWLVMLATTDVLDFFGWLPTRINLNVFSPANLLLFAYTMIAGIISLALLLLSPWHQRSKPLRADPLAKA